MLCIIRNQSIKSLYDVVVFDGESLQYVKTGLSFEQAQGLFPGASETQDNETELEFEV